MESNFEAIKPFNNDPFLGHLATPVSTSTLTKDYLGNLPGYRRGVSPLLRGVEVGLTHGFLLLGPFYKLGPLRTTEYADLAVCFGACGLVVILTACLSIYGSVSFQVEDSSNADPLQSANGWSQFSAGFLVGGLSGAVFAFGLLQTGIYG